MSTIKTIIFDFGDVFINLDKQGAMQNARQLFGVEELPEELVAVNTLYEQGLMSTVEFMDFYTENFPELSTSEIIDAWNIILKDFPKQRLEFLKTLANEQKYKLILLSNTNDLHITWVKENVPFYDEFVASFDAFYLSHEINLRKPNPDIYEFVLHESKLKAEECLFIDDTKMNTDAAALLGIKIWNIDETKEDVMELFTINKHLF